MYKTLLCYPVQQYLKVDKKQVIMFSRIPSCFDTWDLREDKDKYLMVRFSKGPSCFDIWDLREDKDKYLMVRFS
jgi:hypothetical protein